MSKVNNEITILGREAGVYLFIYASVYLCIQVCMYGYVYALYCYQIKGLIRQTKLQIHTPRTRILGATLKRPERLLFPLSSPRRY